MGISGSAWNLMAADALMDGDAVLGVDIDVPRHKLRRGVGPSFQINDDDWRQIEMLLGACDKQGSRAEDRWFDRLLGRAPTLRGSLTEILADHITAVDAGLAAPIVRAQYQRWLAKLNEIEILMAEMADDPSDFLEGIFLLDANTVRNPRLRPNETDGDELHFLWDHGVGPDALMLFVSLSRKNIERAIRVLPPSKPKHWEHEHLARMLARYWIAVTGERPTSGRSNREEDPSRQTGRFADFFRLAVKQLPLGFQWEQSQVQTRVREVVDEIMASWGERAEVE